MAAIEINNCNQQAECCYNQALDCSIGLVQGGQVNGSTLLIDFPFPAFPDNMGHWAEVLAPAYSILSLKSWTQHLPRGDPGRLGAILLLNLAREDLQVLMSVFELLLRC